MEALVALELGHDLDKVYLPKAQAGHGSNELYTRTTKPSIGVPCRVLLNPFAAASASAAADAAAAAVCTRFPRRARSSMSSTRGARRTGP